MICQICQVILIQQDLVELTNALKSYIKLVFLINNQRIPFKVDTKAIAHRFI